MTGIAWAFICATLQTAKDLVSKRLAFQVDGTVSTFASFAFALPFYVVLLFVLWFCGYETFAFSGAFITYLILRSVTDVFAEMSKMYALAHADISFIVCFLNLTPVFLLFTSPVLTGDEISSFGYFAVLFAVLGSLVLTYRPLHQIRQLPWRGITLALTSAFFMSLNVCFDRLAVQQASATLSGFGMTAISAVIILPLMFFKRGRFHELGQVTRPCSVRGFFEVCFMVTKLLALQHLQAPYVSSIMRTSVLFSVVAGGYMFEERERGRRLFAAVLVLIGVYLILLAAI